MSKLLQWTRLFAKPVAFAILLIPVAGCGDSAGLSNSHQHGHSSGHAHSHDHENEEVNALHGGRLTSIGHTHHASGEQHFFAEVMPVVDQEITIYLLTKNETGRGIEFAVDETEIPAYAASRKTVSSSAYPAVFKQQGKAPSAKFVASVPELLQDRGTLSVVVPRILLGGQRRSFSFDTFVAETEDDAVEERPVAAESPGRKPAL